jgi:hypothetical protein
MKNKVTSTNRWSLSTSGSTRASNVGSCCLRFAICFFWLLLVGRPAQAEIKSGDILVVDQVGGRGNLGALILVNPRTGERRVSATLAIKAKEIWEMVTSVALQWGEEGRFMSALCFLGTQHLGEGLFLRSIPTLAIVNSSAT